MHRPIQRWNFDESADLALCAAAYAVGIAKNHAFVDGNKRTAFQIMYLFLGLNGLRLTVEEETVVAIMLDVATDRTDEAALAQWIREHSKRR